MTIDSPSRMPLHLRLLDADGSVDAPALASVAAWASITRVDLDGLGPALRLWSRRKHIAAARQRLAAAGDPHPTLTFLGSGDFHHLAALLIERVHEPFTVLHFDNHPDWVRLAPRWHCGSWVNRVLALPSVQRVVTVGPCSDDLVNPGRKGGNWRALDSGKLVLFPWQHAPSRLRRRIADGPGHAWSGGWIHWRNLAERQLEDAVALVLDAIPTPAVWITIDKDVLPEHEAVTNWDQGQMPLQALEAMLRAVGACKRILGADVCGEYTPPRHRNWLKRLEAWRDQPARAAAGRQGIAENMQTDRQLARTLFDACQGST
ncbi:MAG TPA: hypothetical protein VFJ87_04050 [Rhodanobacteraceae bacterium]|jgi:arginase family enzyme|nr:hypothetical protein [Rhodanobacteraceae bacterium]